MRGPVDMPMRCVSVMTTEMVVELCAPPPSAPCVTDSAAAAKLAGEMEARDSGATVAAKLTLKLRGA